MPPSPQDAREVLAGVRNVWQKGFGIVCRQKMHSDELLADEGFGVTQETLIQDVPRQVMTEGRHKGAGPRRGHSCQARAQLFSKRHLSSRKLSATKMRKAPHPPQLVRSADQLVQVVLTPLAGVRLDVLHRPEAAPHRRAAQRALLVPPPVTVAGLPAAGKHPPGAAP